MPKPFMPKLLTRGSLKIALDVVLIAVPLIVMMFFLTHPDAFDAFLDWMVKTL